MARTFTHIADPHFVQKSKEAENGGGGGLPPVTPENAGEFLRVNDAGKIVTNKYPIERKTNVLYNDIITIEGDNSVNLVEYLNENNFPNLIVKINDVIVEYSDGVYQYTDAITTLVIELDSDYIVAKTGTQAVTDWDINITEPLTIIDPLFKEGINEVSKDMNVSFTKVIVDYEQILDNPSVNAVLDGQDILSLMGRNSVTKTLAYFEMTVPKTFLILSVDNVATFNLVILNLNMIINTNNLLYSGILNIQNSTAILSANLTVNNNLVTAVITATTIS